MADIRDCAHCGAVFAPRREHARFCSAKCRVAWNRQHVTHAADRNPTDRDSIGGESALDWCMAAMLETTGRLGRARGWHRTQAFTVITEAVWWVTMVDATLVRYLPDAHSAVLAAHDPAGRTIIEETFAGLRFVRNRMGYEADHDAFIEPRGERDGRATGRVGAWTWRSVPAPGPGTMTPRGQDWEMSRYRGYQAQLANHPIAGTFDLAGAFLRRAAEAARSYSQPG